jgi:2-aminoadipate transaminase
MDDAPVHFSSQALRTADQPISYFMRQAVENPNLISLAAGLVDPESLPASEAAEAFERIGRRPERARAALQYGTTQGLASLRAKLLARTAALDGMTPREMSLSTEEVVLTTGSQQLLYLISQVLLDPGDIVLTEAPSYFVYQGTLNGLGVRTLSVPMDEQGMNTDALEEAIGRLEKNGELDRLRLIYTCDYFQNPSGRTLALPRRQHMLELVRRFSRQNRIFILEDAAYRELRYDGVDIPSIKSFDRDNTHVILAMTFSKSLSPGLKTGYGFLPRELVGPFLRLKGNHDFGSNNLTQHLLDDLLETGAYDRHVALLCDVYRRKRDALLTALNDEFAGNNGLHRDVGRISNPSHESSDGVSWTRPDGGLYVWMTFPSHVSTGPGSPLMDAALKNGVLYVPGQFCYVNGSNGPVPTNEARLSYGVVPLEQIPEAVRRLRHAAVDVGACASLVPDLVASGTSR